MKNNQNHRLRNFNILLLISITIAILLLLFCNCNYQINDDFSISMIASGVYGQEYSHCLVYSKSVLGWLIKILNNIHPANYYMIIQYLLLIVGASIFGSIVIEKTKNMKAAIFSLLLWWSILFIDIFTNVTYTAVAGLASFIGLLGILMFYDKNIIITIVSITVALFGYFYRYKAFLLITPLILAYILINHKSILKFDGNMRKLTIALISVIIGIVFCEALDLYTYRDKEWKEYIKQNELREKLLDYNNKYIVGEIDNNWSSNDYAMFYSWRNDNKATFGAENLQKIVNKSTPIHNDVKQIINGIISFFIYTFNNAQNVLVLLLLLASFVCGKKVAFKSLSYYIMGICIVIYLLWQGRFPLRISFIIMFCMNTLSYLNVAASDAFINKKFSPLYTVVISLFLIFQMFCYRKQESSDVYNLYKQISSDKQHFYIIDTADFNELVNCFHPIDLIPKDFMNNFVLIGGWACNSPFSKSLCLPQGATNALDLLGNRDDLLFVSSANYKNNIEIVEKYLNEHYNAKIKVEIAERIGGGFISYRFVR